MLEFDNDFTAVFFYFGCLVGIFLFITKSIKIVRSLKKWQKRKNNP